MKIDRIYILFIICAVFVSCHNKETTHYSSVQVSTLVDITDQRVVLPDAETLLSLYDFTGDKNKEAYFRLTTTTDKLLNPVIEHYLPPGSVTETKNQFDDPEFREKEILAFYEAIRHSTDTFDAKTRKDSTLSNSECFRSISEELTHMKERKMTKSVLVIYSDLCENSNLCNVYTPTFLEQFYKHPEAIMKRYEATRLLPDNLSGFVILFIYQPKNREEDKLFTAMEGVYKKMLTRRGATVQVFADNPKYLQL